MNIKNTALCLLCFCSGHLFSQIPQISGFVFDKETGETLQGAIVSDSSSFQYTYSNREGYYNLGLPTGKHIVFFTASGYTKARYTLDVYNSVALTVELEKLGDFEDDTISNLHHTINDYRSGHIAPLASQVADMPALLNENDPVKFLQYLPGVTGGIEGLAGMYVRGGNADQNLVTMDGLPVYGTGHIFGFLSNFNPDIVRDIQFYRGVMPARYGGRAGSVMDVTTLEGGKDEFHGNFSSDIMALKLNAHGPLTYKGRTTISLGMRRSWLDLLLPKNGKNYLFYTLHDYNAKVVFRPDSNNKISVWAYNGRDKFALKSTIETRDSLNRFYFESSKFAVSWQNTLLGLDYSHRFNTRHYGNFILGMSKFRYNFPFSIESKLTSDTATDEFLINYEQVVSITDFILKANLEYTLNASHSLRYGGEIINHTFVPTTEKLKLVSNGVAGRDTTYGTVNKQLAQEGSIYGEWEANLPAGLKINIGSRLWVYSSRERTFIRPEPRVLLSQMLEGKKALKFGFSIANQGIHQLSGVNVNLPNDVWFPTSGNFKPQQNIQLTGGFYQPWRKGIEFSIDLYYKWMNGITDIKSDDDNYFVKNYWEGMVAQGKGTAYGIELLALKKTGRFSGLVSYAWAQSNRTIADINFGNTFPFRWDRRHKFSTEGAYMIDHTMKISFALILMSGNAVSVPTGKYVTVDGKFVYDYSEKNNFRMPFYKRVDVSFTKEIRPDPRNTEKQYWGISIYNVFNFKNPIFPMINSFNPAQIATGWSYFQFIPSVFYKYEF